MPEKERVLQTPFYSLCDSVSSLVAYLLPAHTSVSNLFNLLFSSNYQISVA